MPSRAIAAACLLAVSMLALRVEPAAASCLADPPEILWSHPADGDTDVPTDADLLLLLSGAGAGVVVELDGEPLSRVRFDGRFELGELEPRQQYQVVVRFDALDTTAELSFTTGDGPAGADGEAPTIDGFERLGCAFTGPCASGPAICDRALWLGTCFDTGTPAVFELQVTGEAALWALESITPSTGERSVRLFPPECMPSGFDTSGTGDTQWILHGLDVDGSVHSSEPFPIGQRSLEQSIAQLPSRDRGGCSAAAGSGSGVLPALMLPWLLMRLRRRTQSHARRRS